MKTNKILEFLASVPTAEEVEKAQAILASHSKESKKHTPQFDDCPELLPQFLAIKRELNALDVSIGRYVESINHKQWLLTRLSADFAPDKTAALYWSSATGWSVESNACNIKIGEIWEGFNLEEYLSDNDVVLETEEE